MTDPSRLSDPPPPPPAPPYGGYGYLPPPQPHRRFRWNSWRGALSILVIIGGALFLIGGISQRTGGNEFVAAQKKCDSNPPGGTTISDGGRTLVINMQGTEDTSGMTAGMAACVLHELHVTSAVAQHMDSTRALDGRQSDRWDGYTASWTYHPNDGLDIVIQRS